MSRDLSYTSIAEIHSALSQREQNPRDLYDYIMECDVNESDAEQKTILGSETDYHNLTVEFSRQNCAPYAASVAGLGVKVYPMSTTLLADAIKYYQEIGDSKSCRIGYEKLKSISRKYWTWRTFVFVIDFLKDSLSTSSSIEEFENNLEDAKQFIADFKTYIPHEERSYVAEAELYQNENNYESAINALRDGVKNVGVAPQCCMKLADMYLELGKYSEVETYAKKGLLAAVQDQPTVSVAYLYYLLAMSMDAGRIMKKQSDESVDESRIQEIVTAYQTADRLFKNEGRTSVTYRKTIASKLIMIEMEEGVPADRLFDESKTDSSILDEKDSHISMADLRAFRDMLKNENND